MFYIAREKFSGLPQKRKTLKRYGSSNNLVDNFSYSYISNTNKLSRVSGLADQYTYDYNGNMTLDDVNRNHSFIYDHRNLLIEIRHISPGGGGVANVDTLFQIKYRYDEAGNRIQKTRWKYVGINPDPVFEEDNPYTWQLLQNEYYVRDVSGKEIAIYDNTYLDQWNVWGLDNVGKIESGNARYFYLKDHLGSVRAIVNTNNIVTSSQDYDMWGSILDGRSYTLAGNKYKFTGKERDNESNYDYFGARYYDSRIGNWTSVDPVLEKHWQLSPYNYAIRNPLLLIDPDGRQVKFHSTFTASPNFKEAISNLGKFAGISLSVDNDGFLRGKPHFGNKDGLIYFGEGSETARKWVIKMLMVPNGLLDVFSIGKKGSYGINKGSLSEINLDPKQINSFKFVGLDPRTMGWAMVLIEEFLHTQYGMNKGHPTYESDLEALYADAAMDPILEEMNKIRSELEEVFGNTWGYQTSHEAVSVNGTWYILMSTSARTMWLMDRTKTPEQPYIYH